MGKKKQPIREMNWEAIEAGSSFFEFDDMFTMHSQAAALYRDEIYIYGGKDEADEPRNIFIKYNTSTLEYTKLSIKIKPKDVAVIKESDIKLPSIYQHTLTYIEGREGESDVILLIGGKWRKPHSDHEIVNDKVYAYDVSSNCWETMSVSGFKGRFDHSASLHPNANDVYVFGGTDRDGNVLSDLLKLDLTQQQWLPCSTKGKSIPKGTSGHSAVVHDDYIYFFGGRSTNELSNEMHRLNMNSLQWEKIGSSQKKSHVYPKKRSGHAAVALYNKMIMYGGDGHHISPGQIWEFDFDLATWSLPSVSNDDSPLQGYTITGHSLCVKDRKVWMVGGLAQEKGEKRLNEYIYALDTQLEGMKLIERPPSTFSTDLLSLINDRYTSDLSIELHNGEIMYLHLCIISIRCRAFYIYLLRHHTGDQEVHWEDMMDHIRKSRKTPFPYALPATLEVKKEEMMTLLQYIYVERWPTFDDVHAATKMMFIAYVLHLKHLMNYCHHFVQVLNPSSPTPTSSYLEWHPTLSFDMKKLCDMMFDHVSQVTTMEQEEKKHQNEMEQAAKHDELLKRDVSTTNKSNLVASLSSPLGDTITQDVFSTSDTSSSSTSLSPFDDSSTTSSLLTRYSKSSAFDDSFDATCDVHFDIHGELIASHAAILIARSRYFKHLLFQHRSSSSNNQKLVIPIFGVQPNVFKMVLKYLYVDDATPPYRFALELLIAAETYGLSRLSATCQRVVARKIALYNVCSYLHLCREYGLEDLQERCEYYAIHHLNQLRKHKTFSRLPYDVQLHLKETKKQMKQDLSYDLHYEQSIRHNHHFAKFQHKKDASQ
mmetsp:Transcript_11485/g.16989  ORF Transcript_11485/g.16989 Transcript_11485/m.16989 type:complete len:822 (+) Transcript_11485:84-2549(+)|eukprot:CAMPEP_0117423240 /NCGR_PEP_ID=MMETSP0758-20121206/3911_1 /TAXON_ID=63605 /ORGANISM="Percolomonas cosmopolitus, Strain AE-1 (ATCC 50343)" /LENGTH=821 /DNA_ID=CAMNT_0005206325 /DNA_START=30 /DNA_END=2495 /DNA_ORIENTATION=-